MLVIRFVNNGFKQYTWRGVETPPPTVRWFKPRDKLKFAEMLRLPSAKKLLTKPFFYVIVSPVKHSSLHTNFRGEALLMAKNLEITILMDFYGDMLTAKQREFLDLYYNEDLSLAEIAANVGITRQGVRDAIKRAECQLIEMEERLKLVSRFREVQKGLEEIMDCATRISAENRKSGLSREINDLTVRIKSIAISLSE